MHADVERAGLAPGLARDDHQAAVGAGQADAAVEGLLVGSVEDDDELGRGRVAERGVDEAGQQRPAAPGGDDHRHRGQDAGLG